MTNKNEQPNAMNESNFRYPMSDIEMREHHCSTVVIGCIDFRFRKANDAFVEEGLGEKNFDTLNLPGGGKNLVAEGPEREVLVKAIEKVCRELHGVKRIVLMNHWDCGAYGGSKHFHDAASEEAKHTEDLEAARDYMQGRFPDLQIVIVYNKLVGDSLEYNIIEEEADEEEAA